MSQSLTRVVSWGHELLGEKIKKGQLVVDLTAGNGHDTLMLYRQVGETGQVLAFDIQLEALQNTQLRLQKEGASVRIRVATKQPLLAQPGVDLVHAGHQQLDLFLPGAPQAVIANLGYLPGSDQTVVTRPESTLAGLGQASKSLSAGGRIAVVVYPGHPGGKAEGEMVDGFFSSLEDDTFQVLRINVANRPQAPYLLVAEKRA